MLRHGSLFSGIGGFDLAAEWAGWNNLFHCEWNEFCQKVLKYHFPNSTSYGDITKTDFTIWRGKIDVLSGGFPCQPYSVAGKRKGKDDERHLWPEMCRTIREIKPRWVVGENVYGLVSWNDGMVFNEVCTDLENEGYEVQSYIIPACSQDAPHKRDRIFIVAHSNCCRNNFTEGKEGSVWQQTSKDEERNGRAMQDNGLSYERTTSNTESIGTGGLRNESQTERSQYSDELFGIKHTIPNWDNFPTQSPICGGNDGLPTELDGITFSKWRNESIRGYGNAIVPQIALKIFESINQYETAINEKK
jgi:DNA (cytosine-5)-methyltransferase 1